MSATLTFIDNPQQSPVNRRVAIAFGVSTFLHGLVLLLFLDHGVRFADLPAHLSLTVMLPMKPLAPVTPDDRQTSQSAKTTSHQLLAPDRFAQQQADTSTASASEPSSQASHESEGTAQQHIDIDAAYRIARQAARSPRKAPASVQIETAAPLEQETLLSRSISKAARPDCRTAYAGGGLFALPFLIASAIADRGCKW